MFFSQPHFVRTRGGDYKLRLDPDERALLSSLPDQMEELVSLGAAGAGEDPLSSATVRLFPPAYVDDAEYDAEYHRLMRSELIRRRLEALATVRETLTADRLTGEQLDAWLRVLNDVRLVLGTILDVSEDEDPLDIDADAEDVSQRMVYVILSSLVSDAVDALSGALPPPAPA